MAKMMVVSLAFALVVCGLLWSTAEAESKTMVQDTYKARAPEGKRGVKDPNKAASAPEGKKKDPNKAASAPEGKKKEPNKAVSAPEGKKKDHYKASAPEGKRKERKDHYKASAPEGKRVVKDVNTESLPEGKTMVQDLYKERALNEKPIPANPYMRGCNANHQCRGGSRRLSNLEISSHGVQQPIRGN